MLCITLCLLMIRCTYTWFKCYCMSRWLAWLLLAWCSHGYCDVIDLVIRSYLPGSCVLSCRTSCGSGPRIPVIVDFF